MCNVAFPDYSSRLCRARKTIFLLITLQATDAERRQALSTFKQRRLAPERADFVLKIRTVELNAGQNTADQSADEKIYRPMPVRNEVITGAAARFQLQLSPGHECPTAGAQIWCRLAF